MNKRFNDIYQEHSPYVIGFLRRLPFRGLSVEDVNQEVFLAVFQKLANFEARSSLRTWIIGIAYHKAYSWMRKEIRKPTQGGEALDAVEDSGGASPELACADDERRALLLRALDRIPFEQRLVFILYELEGCSIEEIMEITGSNRFTLYGRLGTARRKIRAFFDRINQGKR